MEASTQPQPAIPSKVFPDQPAVIDQSEMPTEELKKKRNLPLIISLILFFLVIAVLLVLFFLTNNQSNSNSNNTVSPVSFTSTTPETSGVTNQTSEPTTNSTQNTFESRLFYLGFDYPTALTTDTTTRITYPDGTTWCFAENAAGENIDLSIYEGGKDCHGGASTPAGDKYDTVTRDAKPVVVGISADTASNGYTATAVFDTATPLPMTFRLNIKGTTADEAKRSMDLVLATLTFDTAKLKSELTDKVTTPSYGQP